jgi:hypothetical protein
MPSFSIWNQENYYYETEIIEMIIAIRIEREARRKNNQIIDTTFADDLLKAIQK